MKKVPAQPGAAAAAAATPSRPYDPLLDPLPQPEVQESDTDTAWGRWQDVLGQDHSAAAPDGPEPDPPSFADTVPMGLPELPPGSRP